MQRKNWFFSPRAPCLTIGAEGGCLKRKKMNITTISGEWDIAEFCLLSSKINGKIRTPGQNKKDFKALASLIYQIQKIDFRKILAKKTFAKLKLKLIAWSPS